MTPSCRALLVHARAKLGTDTFSASWREGRPAALATAAAKAQESSPLRGASLAGQAG